MEGSFSKRAKDGWKCDKREAQIKALVAFFSQEKPCHELFSDMLRWFIKNPLSILYNLRSFDSSTIMAQLLLNNVTIRSKFKEYLELISVVKFYPDEMKKIVSNHSLSSVEKQQQLLDCLQQGTNPTHALNECINYNNFECFSFLISHASWITNNKNVWQAIKNHRKKNKKIIINYLNQPLSISLQRNILYSIGKTFSDKTSSEFILNNLLSKNITFESFPLHKYLKHDADINLIQLLVDSKKFDVNACYKGKTTVNILFSRSKFHDYEISILELLQKADAHFDNLHNNDQKNIENILSHLRNKLHDFWLQHVIYEKYYTAIKELENIVKNLQNNAK